MVALLTMILGGCGGTGPGTAFPALSPKSGAASSESPRYDEPPDRGGFSTQPWDQPLPLPTRQSGNACGWLESALPALQPLGAVSVEDRASGCQFALSNGQGAQVHLYGPYNRITEDTALLQPVDIAGIKGRVYVFDPPPSIFCSVELDIRAYASLKVDGYELSSDEAGDRQAHCELAMRVAEVIAKRYVPLAGGTPWPQTRQQPADDVLSRTEPCETVRFTDVNYGGISSGRDSGRQGSTVLGPTCQYQSDYASATVQIVTATTGLAQLPQHSGTRGQDTAFGVLPARIEQAADRCWLSVQFGNGQVLQLEFTPNRARDYPITCMAAKVIMASAMATLIAEAS
jgi:hypothetical protein